MKDDTLYKQRTQALQALYNRIKSANGVNFRFLKQQSIWEMMAKEPAPRFYITPEYAARYITAYYKHGGRITSGNAAMIEELVKYYEIYRKLYSNFAKWKIYDMVVNSPAQSFYMSPQRIKEIIFNYTGRNKK